MDYIEETGGAAPEIRAEREFMELCRAKLLRMRGEAEAMLDRGAAEGDAVVDKYFNHALREFRKKTVADLSGFDDAPLFFGRLDYAAGEVFDDRPETADPDGTGLAHTRTEDSDLLYVGRRGVRDADGEPVVIDWRASLSRAFYEASPLEPMGVRVRRRYGFDQAGLLSAFEDEPIEGAPVSPGASRLVTREIERPRQGPMRDIVATIQPEQMRLVRAPLDETVCIQGAPGTGKTAVGLHRLAYLLFAERERLRKEGGVAVIGPNSAFLAYIHNVLPALGEVEVVQLTIDDLTGPGLEVSRVDDARAARVKGGPAMAEVLRRHLWARIGEPDEEIEVRHQQRIWRVPVSEQAEELAAVLERGTTYGAGRELYAQRLANLVLRRMERASGTSTTLTQLSKNRGIGQALRRLWPVVDPGRLVFELLTDPVQLAGVAAGVLSAEDQRAIVVAPRPRSMRSMPWSTLDLALVDEVAGLLGRPVRLGHVVVDEAQDLSPMHLRAIARRLAGACTVLGDLAQATSPSAVRGWPEVLTRLNRPDGAIEVLDRGYRVPAEVLGFAARLLPHLAPDLTGPTSFRPGEDSLRVTGTGVRERTPAIVEACESALAGEGSVCVLSADADVPALHRELVAAALAHTVLGEEVPNPERLTLAPVSLAKGLEYDTVVVVEPARIVAAEPRGLQRLYVALTRAVSRLHVIHAEPLPEPLREAVPAAGVVVRSVS
ncbi:HelD family protein [Amycolatopsis jiangsuensis]|uniref:DNA helicase IV n=1 Tax=Amycolatopsis jiangsuensis TaxID=1181879 RepID=A0A840ING7_9PSEU|nr:ATP-binding domain-containing protein [Amycolatopsis jiangsuensis]MBB4683906.1 DNA helicase IV [Amycolatopsis jiangsuensis]